MRSHPDLEQELDRFIDALAAERRPEPPSTAEMAELQETARRLKALKDPAEPSPGFETRLLGERAQPGRSRFPLKWLTAAGLAAAVLLVAVLVPIVGRQDVALAMAKAVDRVERYHGSLEVRVLNAAGVEQVVRAQEVWVDGDRYAVWSSDGTITVNNGERKWQVRPADLVVAMLPIAPDPQRIGLDLKVMADAARRYPYRVIGRDSVAGRPADILQISPPGGDPYRLWVDAELDLPVRLVTAMQNGLQTIYTYTQLNANQPIDASRFAFNVPEGYRTVETDPGQQVSAPSEAAAQLGFEPLVPDAAPDRMIAYQNRLVLEYGETAVIETRAEGDFRPATYGAIGTAAGGPLEVLTGRLRWRQGDLEITVAGPQAQAIARAIASDLRLPAADQDFPQEPQVPVAVDMEVARNSQQQVDGGHSPYLLDPTMVTMSYLGTQGIPGDMDTFRLAFSTGTHAVVEVPSGPISRVYLKRLVRQDETGIWSVVGHDPR